MQALARPRYFPLASRNTRLFAGSAVQDWNILTEDCKYFDKDSILDTGALALTPVLLLLAISTDISDPSSVPTFFRGERAVEAQFLNFCMGRVV